MSGDVQLLMNNTFDLVNNEYQAVKGRTKVIEIPFDISLKLDYENDTNEKTIELNKETANKVFGKNVDRGKITITPYGIDV